MQTDQTYKCKKIGEMTYYMLLAWENSVKIYKFWTRFQVWSQTVLTSKFLGLARQAGKFQTD